jgi:uncharacterized protein (TIGR03083 family)
MNAHQHPTMSPSTAASRSLLKAIDSLPPSAPTACAGWTAHEVVAHLAAGAKEVSDLVEERLFGGPDRPTKGFEEREAPFRSLHHDKLRDRLVAENRRKLDAYAALSAQRGDASIALTGTRMTASEMAIHSMSEAAMHGWDLVGDDDLSTELLGSADLTAHAVKVLNRMPTLNESAQALTRRMLAAVGRPAIITLRSPPLPDVVLIACPDDGRLELVDQPRDSDASLTTTPANRLLLLWGRLSTNWPIDLDGDPNITAQLSSVLWPNAVPWPAQ